MHDAVTPSVSIKLGNQEIFAVVENGMVLVPTVETERAAVFVALMDALSILAGVKLPSTAATEGAANYLQQTQRYPGEIRRRGDFALLKGRQDTENEPSLP
jgi:hypothetical protein